MKIYHVFRSFYIAEGRAWEQGYDSIYPVLIEWDTRPMATMLKI